MNLIEQVSSSDGDGTWSDVPDRQEGRAYINGDVKDEELKEDSGRILNEKDITKNRKQHVGVTLGCISVFISMVTIYLITCHPYEHHPRANLTCSYLCIHE